MKLIMVVIELEEDEHVQITREIKTDIINEIANWKKDLPKTIDIIDEVAFHCL